MDERNPAEGSSAGHRTVLMKTCERGRERFVLLDAAFSVSSTTANAQPALAARRQSELLRRI